MPKTKDLTASIDLLNLTLLDLLPEMSAVLADRDELAAKIEAVEAERLATGKYLSYCSNSSPENPALFATLIADGQAKMKTLEAEERKLRAEVSTLDQAVHDARVQTRRDILPELRRLGLPAIEGRIAQLGLPGASAEKCTVRPLGSVVALMNLQPPRRYQDC
jgi:hypothetical protein